MKLINSFMFFNEQDLLEFRLKLPDKQVDHLIIAVSNYTYSGACPGPAILKKLKNDLNPGGIK